MRTFADIKEGDILLKKGRRIRTSEKTIMEWVAVEVEKVTRAFYFVNGEKYRKDQEGKSFMDNLYFPGQDGAPETATPPGEFDSVMEKIRKLPTTNIFRVDFGKIQDLDKAVELSEKLNAVIEEIEAAYSTKS